MKKIMKKLFKAADNHADDTGEADHAVGDLQGLLLAAWALMTPVQQQMLLKSDEVEELVEAGARNEFSALSLISDHAEFTNVRSDQTFEHFRHADLAAIVNYFDNKEQTMHRASLDNVRGEVRESPYAAAARFIRSVVEAQLQKTPAFWYSEQHGQLKLRHAYESANDRAYAWHPLFTGVNADVRTISLPDDWPTAAMEDAFATALPTYSRDEVDDANDTGRVKLTALFDDNNFSKAMRAAFAAAPVIGVEDDVRYQSVRQAVAAALRGNYYCGRTWSAWNVGTMTESDFSPSEDVSEVVDGITAAAIAAGKMFQ